MGSYSKGANGTISGKFGSVIGSSWRGIDYLKGLPKKRTKKSSEAQLSVQARFTLAAAQLRPIKDILYIGFGDKKLNKITGYNAAVKAFLAEAILGEFPEFTVNYPKMTLSKGSLRPLKGLTMALDASGALTLSWPYAPNRDTFIDDQVTVVVYNQTSNLYDTDESAIRGDGAVTVNLDLAEDDVIHVWVFCVKRDGKVASPSQYVGTVTAGASI